MHKHKKRHALIAGLAVSSLAFSGLGVSAVFAADDVTPVESPAPVSSIANTPVELVIHKYTPSSKSDADTKALATGKEITNPTTDLPGAKKVEGVKFVPYKVQYDGKDIDLKTNAGWVLVTKFKALFDLNKAASSWADASGKRFTLVKGTGKDTDGTGSVTFTETAKEVSKTLYIFKEEIPTDLTKIKIDGQPLKDQQTLTPASPFLVTLPLTDPTNLNTWMYKVHVYPKNSVTAVKKEVGDQKSPGAGVTNGSIIPYYITADVPKSEHGFDKFYLIDILPTQLTYVGNKKDANQDKVALGTLTPQGVFTEETGVTFAENIDYDIIVGPYSGTELKHKGKSLITIQFTEAGLKKLEANQGKKVRWTLNAQVTVSGVEISNSAVVVPIPEGESDNGWNPRTPNVIPPGPETPEVKSYYGNAVIQKRGTDNENKGLPGATFRLYQCNEDGKYIKPDFSVATDKEEARVTAKNKNEWTTLEDGNITIEGLLVNDWRNNSATMADGTNWSRHSFYCLEETKAPSGYEILPKPVMFQISKDSSDKTVNVKVLDVPKNGNFALPLTGANGIAMMVVIGVLLVGGSGLYVAAVTRRNKKEADKKGIA